MIFGRSSVVLHLPQVLCDYRYTEPDFLFVRSWLPCVFFSGGVTMGNIGRQLAAVSIFMCRLKCDIALVLLCISLSCLLLCQCF